MGLSYSSRPRRSEPAGRRVRQREAASGRRQATNRGARAQRRQALRHIQAAAGVSRMRFQDSQQVICDASVT